MHGSMGSRALLLSAAALAATAVSSPAPARAEADEGADVARAPWYGATPRRHSGVVVGAIASVEAATASGYPNKADLIGDPAHLSTSGLGAGGGGSFFVMGALTDWLSIGATFTASRAQSSTYRTGEAGGGVRVEVFPLQRLLPLHQDAGLTATFGVGSATIDAKAANAGEGASGVQSFVGAGAFYEWNVTRLFGGHVALGPSVDFGAVFAAAVSRFAVSAGPRIAFYGGL